MPHLSDSALHRKEIGWGYIKILQAMRRLGHRISRQAVKNILVEAGLAPEPNYDPDNESAFLRRHAETLWQCDLASKKKWTVIGMVDVYFLVFIHIGTRRIWASPCTEHPTHTWTTQQARDFQLHLKDKELPCEILMRDNDQKYPKSFGEVFRSTHCQIKRNTPASPNLQGHVERVVQTLKHEVLNAFCILSDAHLDYILKAAMG